MLPGSTDYIQDLSAQFVALYGAAVALKAHQTVLGLQAAVLGVPFVDALTTERDATLPLTVGEWEEWGAVTKTCTLRCCCTLSG